MHKADIGSMDIEETRAFMGGLGESLFRGSQVFSRINRKGASSFDEMTELSLQTRELLKEKAYLAPASTIKKQVSHADHTTKYLFEMKNGNIIEERYTPCLVESVAMYYHHGISLCLSTQAGCRMGCKFCASGLEGLDRNLTAGEIAAQVYAIGKDLGLGLESGVGAEDRIASIVLMGCGEPLDNFDNVIKFIKIINSKEGANIGQRHITLSTCGLVDRIYDLMKCKLSITLAVSLHAPNDGIRKKLMPVAHKYPMDNLLKACREYGNRLRRVTYEYALIEGVNDSLANAEELAGKLKGSLCHVNLIPANSVKETLYKGSGKLAIDKFASILTDKGIDTTIRRRLGPDIDAACGQLRKGSLS